MCRGRTIKHTRTSSCRVHRWVLSQFHRLDQGETIFKPSVCSRTNSRPPVHSCNGKHANRHLAFLLRRHRCDRLLPRLHEIIHDTNQSSYCAPRPLFEECSLRWSNSKAGRLGAGESHGRGVGCDGKPSNGHARGDGGLVWRQNCSPLEQNLHSHTISTVVHLEQLLMISSHHCLKCFFTIFSSSK